MRGRLDRMYFFVALLIFYRTRRQENISNLRGELAINHVGVDTNEALFR
jgi:hypothetical protein